MKPVITYENLRSFAYSNDKSIKGEIRGVCVDFFGLGGDSMFDADTDNGKGLADLGIINIIPYYNPWAWMNRQSVEYADEIIDVIYAHYDLPENTPLVYTGGSMGGLSALVFTKYSKRTPTACFASCPVCDLPFHYTERPDLPRTLYSAFGCYDAETLEDALVTASPLHLAKAGKMPDTKYVIFHSDADSCVNIHAHSEKLVAEMKRLGMDVDYHIIPGRDHCDLGTAGFLEWGRLIRSFYGYTE